VRVLLYVVFWRFRWYRRWCGGIWFYVTWYAGPEGVSGECWVPRVQTAGPRPDTIHKSEDYATVRPKRGSLLHLFSQCKDHDE
jgi:hypothetical protein